MERPFVSDRGHSSPEEIYTLRSPDENKCWYQSATASTSPRCTFMWDNATVLFAAECVGVTVRLCIRGSREAGLAFKGNKRIWNLCHVGKQRAYVCVDIQTHSGRSCLAWRLRERLITKKAWVQLHPSVTFHSLTSKRSPCDRESNSRKMFPM